MSNILHGRDQEVISAVQAISLRFRKAGLHDLVTRKQITTDTDIARTLVMKRVAEGDVELSTLQSLCLLSILDFTGTKTPISQRPLLTDRWQLVMSPKLVSTSN